MTDVALAEQPNITDLVTAKSMDKDALMAMLGQKDLSVSNNESNRSFLPRLSIEHNTEDDEGKTLPRGKWRVKNANGEIIHSDTVIFRPYLRRYMYSVWDQSEQMYSSMTIQATSFGDKFFDTTGGLKCGKITGKELDLLAPDDPARTIQAGIKCSQIIYGTASLSGNAEAIPHVWYAKGSNFMPVSDWIKTLEKQGKLLFNTRATLTTSRQKYGGNIFYKASIKDKDTVEFAPDKDVPLLESFMDIVNLHNSDIEKKYKESRQDFEDVEIVDSLDE
tara:strand:+ start:569 stop:1399 length:831 start_codon:yes stop_codon:yes gene_type:complete